MKVPPIYAAFCLVVLLAFTAAKVEGLSLFSNTGITGGNSGGTGGHGGGVLLGMHK